MGLTRLVPWGKMIAFRSGIIETGLLDTAAGPCWAEVNGEVYSPWITHGREQTIPFSQVHGHDAPIDWGMGVFWASATDEIKARCLVDPFTRRTETELGPGLVGRPAVGVSVDWKLGAKPGADQGFPVFWLEGDELIVWGTGPFRSMFDSL